MSTSKIIIVVEYCGQETTVEYTPKGALPTFYGSGDEQCITFVKGVLFERAVPHDRILEVYTTKTIYSAYEEGLEALAEQP